MKHAHLLIAVCSSLLGTASLPLAAAELVLLKDPDPQMALKIESSTEAKGGRSETKDATGQARQSIDITRTRLIHRTMHPDAIGGEVSYRIFRDGITTTLNGKPSIKSGGLEGRTAKARKNGAGNWTFSIPGASAFGEAAGDLEMLGGFENRKWLPGRKVAIGESWNFAPNFIRRALQRDVPNPQVIGIMKLRKVEKAADGTRQAVIDCYIRGGGSNTLVDGAVAEAETGLAGTLTVNLDQPGLMKLYLSGRLNTGTSNARGSARAVMPLNMSVKISPLLAPTR
ncbi:hypothetical protein [Haloferula sp.]|uniref:hypothetical protein n=1 Tax=Haloferula sp. TaxID=2497595 RepID=UPI00329E3DB8